MSKIAFLIFFSFLLQNCSSSKNKLSKQAPITAAVIEKRAERSKATAVGTSYKPKALSDFIAKNTSMAYRLDLAAKNSKKKSELYFSHSGLEHLEKSEEALSSTLGS